MKICSYRFQVLSIAMAAMAVATACSGGKKDKNTLTIAMSGEPPELNATKATDSESFFILGHTMEGLTRVGADGKPAPGVAEKWEITEKGATFWLRKNALWSDGKPVTAHDFVYSWQTVVNSKNASEYAFILYPIKNAETINTKKTAVETLGVQAEGDHTLKVTFEKPCGYFLALTSFATYFPVRKDFHEKQGEKYGAEANTLLYNGPFMLTEWVHGAKLKLEKNPNYWNAATIKLAKIDIPYITPDDSARFNLFKDKKTDVLGLNKDNLQTAQREGFRLKKFADGSVFFLEYNFLQGRILNNKNLRKALQSVFNAEEFVNKVIGVPGTQPGLTLIPQYMTGKKELFRQDYPIQRQPVDIEAGKKFLAAAMKELKLKEVPALVWLTGDSPTSSKEAEYFQNLFKTTLGIELRIDKQIFKQRLAKMSAGEFDIVSAGWGPDYNDPMTFADLLTSWNENNRGRWKNAQYDELIRKAQGTTNQTTRMDAMAAAEKLMLEEMPILPLFERSVVYTHADHVQGIVRRQVGFDPDYTGVEIKTN